MELKKLPLWLKQATWQRGNKIKLSGEQTCLLLCSPKGRSELNQKLSPLLAPWQISQLKKEISGLFSFQTPRGPLSIILFKNDAPCPISQGTPLNKDCPYTFAREMSGQFLCQIDLTKTKQINWYGLHLEQDSIVGSLVGLEMAAYQYKKINLKNNPPLKLTHWGELSQRQQTQALQKAKSMGKAINLARYLVDLPPSEKRPQDYARAVKNYFQGNSSLKMSLWDHKRLEKERMGMLLAVGQGSVQKPHLVHLRYRPSPSQTKIKYPPIAFVGKGITFDTGGLNLKPGNSMRFMKKDMGGSAALMGLAHWVVDSHYPLPCDFYLALAENSVDAHSFRPGDVLTARNGLKVEIDNTDAEGRLALGDTLALASEAKGSHRPGRLIDVATLTGAIKVGLGSDIGGFFSNSEELAQLLEKSAQKSGDPFWRMPLMESQRKKLKSDVADLCNSAGGFGGAIRAATFLQEFTGPIPWAHFDLYAWKDSPGGPFQSSGGSGQGVQCLIHFLNHLSLQQLQQCQ